MFQKILIFSIFLSPLTAGIKMQFDVTAHCSTGYEFCIKQDIYEIDWQNDDWLGSSKVCGNGTLKSELVVEESDDGYFDDEMELKSVVTHDCSLNGQIGKTEYYLSSFDGYQSVSNYGTVSALDSPSQPIKYDTGDLLNRGTMSDCV